MTHTTRIPISKELSDAFGKANSDGNTRWLKVEIHDEQLELINTGRVTDLAADFDVVQGIMEAKKPCYVVFRLDEAATTTGGFQWILLAYTPDGSKVRDRMLYASTRDTLKKELGRSYFVDELYGSEKDELDYAAYQAHLEDKNSASAPLTKAEVQYRAEVSMELDSGGKTEGVHSLKFPLSSEAQQAIKDFVGFKHNLVQLSVDTKNESIELVKAAKCTVDRVVDHLPADSPRFTYFFWEHVHRGNSHSSTVFIYSNPDGTGVRERMLYSSVKSVMIAYSDLLGVTVDTKIELSDIPDLTEEYIESYVHPPERKIIKKQAFSRPTRAGAGNRRKPTRKPRGE